MARLKSNDYNILYGIIECNSTSLETSGLKNSTGVCTKLTYSLFVSPESHSSRCVQLIGSLRVTFVPDDYVALRLPIMVDSF